MENRIRKFGDADQVIAGGPGSAGIWFDSVTDVLKVNAGPSDAADVKTITDTAGNFVIDGDWTFTGTIVISGSATKTEFADGTVSLPSITFSADLNSGIYRIGADNIGVAVNGTKILDIATTGLTIVGTLNKVTVTAPATAATLTLIDGTTVTGPAATGTLATLGNTETFTGVKSFIGATSGAATAALIFGGGTSVTPCTTATADKNFIGFWSQSTATSGDSRGMYLRHYLGAAGSGEALRVFATATAADVATGGTANGAHISFSLSGASASISGQAHAARFTLGADAETRTLNANMAVINLDSDLATGNTSPAGVAFIKITDTAAVRINTLFRLPNASAGTLVSTHTTDAISHSIKCVLDDGTVLYLMATTTASNRA